MKKNDHSINQEREANERKRIEVEERNEKMFE